MAARMATRILVQTRLVGAIAMSPASRAGVRDGARADHGVVMLRQLYVYAIKRWEGK
jgi:hypothetical protein